MDTIDGCHGYHGWLPWVVAMGGWVERERGAAGCHSDGAWQSPPAGGAAA